MNFDSLYLELVDSTTMIQALLSGVSQEDAQVKPAANSWSILETLCHLYDEERLDFRPRLDALLHAPDQEWPPIEPEAWVTSRNYNGRDLHDVKQRFFAERSKSLDWLKGLRDADWSASRLGPSGPLSAGDLFVSWVAHDNLAVRQLVELRRARLEQMVKPYSLDYAGPW